MMVYQALPASSQILLTHGQLTLNVPGGETYWEYNDGRDRSVNERFAMIHAKPTRDRLLTEMQRVRELLLQTLHLRGWADEYQPDRVGTIMDRAYSDSPAGTLPDKLLRAEAGCISQCISAGRKMARFGAEAGTQPEEALEALAEAGEALVRTFNSRLQGALFGGRAFRQLASLVFLEAARALDPALASVRPAARLTITLLRGSATDTVLDSFLAGAAPDVGLVVLEQPVVGLPDA